MGCKEFSQKRPCFAAQNRDGCGYGCSNSVVSVDTAPQADYDNTNNQGGKENADTKTERGSLHSGRVQRNTQGYSQRETAGGAENGGADARSGSKSGIPRAGNQGHVYATDSEGVELTPEVKFSLQGTAVTDSSGAPLAVYVLDMVFSIFLDLLCG